MVLTKQILQHLISASTNKYIRFEIVNAIEEHQTFTISDGQYLAFLQE